MAGSALTLNHSTSLKSAKDAHYCWAARLHWKVSLGVLGLCNEETSKLLFAVIINPNKCEVIIAVTLNNCTQQCHCQVANRRCSFMFHVDGSLTLMMTVGNICLRNYTDENGNIV